MSKLKNWKESASLLVACKSKINVPPNPSKINFPPPINHADNLSSKEEYKILMMERNVNSPFMPSKRVFPGGVLSEADWQADWKGLFEGVAAPAYQQFVDKLASSGTGYPMQEENKHLPLPADITFRICAIRETFEETGLLLVVDKEALHKSSGNSHTSHKQPHHHDHNEELTGEKGSLGRGVSEEVQKEAGAWRKKVTNDTGQFLNMCASMQVVPDVWSLYEWNNWLTPVFKKKSSRYDTLFYLCCLQCQQLPVVEADNFESTRLDWSEPSTFMSQHPDGGYTKSVLAPPQSYELIDLKQFPTLDSLQQEASHRTFAKRPRTRLWPALGIYKDAFITILPGDRLYDEWMAEESMFETEDASLDSFDKASGPLHRLLYDHQYPNGRIIRAL